MPQVEIIGFSVSTFVRSVAIACVEKGVDFAWNDYGLTSPADLQSEAFLRLNPFGKIPVLRHGDVVIYETTAICRYIDAAFDGSSLVPDEPRQAARMEQWSSALVSSVDRNLVRRYVIAYAFPTGPDGTPDRAVIDEALPDVARDLAAIDNGLADGPFFCGTRPSIADFIFLPMVDYVAEMPEGASLLDAVPNVRRFRSTFAGRKSYGETTPDELRKRKAA